MGKAYVEDGCDRLSIKEDTGYEKTVITFLKVTSDLR